MDIRSRSIFFAPMEGITDSLYREVVGDIFPEWDFFTTHFLRIPTESIFSDKKVISHFGDKIFANKVLKEKTIFQVLASPRSKTIETTKQIKNLGFDKLDLNIGCPSKRVNSHQGGAFLLSDLSILQKIVSNIRKNFDGFFSVKMRIGYRNDLLFLEILKLLESEGVNAITLHARTRDQLYKGRADWNYIKIASENTNIPIIGNGDIWNLSDVKNVFSESLCHSIMMARGALAQPWLAKYIKNPHKEINISRETLLYFNSLHAAFIEKDIAPEHILKRLKSFSHYIFNHTSDSADFRKTIFRTQELDKFMAAINSI